MRCCLICENIKSPSFVSGKNLEEHLVSFAAKNMKEYHTALLFQVCPFSLSRSVKGSIYIWALGTTGSLPQLWANHGGRNLWAIVNQLLPCFNTILCMLVIADSEISYGFSCELLFTIYFNHLKYTKEKKKRNSSMTQSIRLELPEDHTSPTLNARLSVKARSGFGIDFICDV